MRAGIKPDTVIAAAADIADRDGWSEVTLSNVAGLLGIKTPSLYNHIAGLDDLRGKLSVHASRLLLGALVDAAVGRAGKEAFVEVGRAYVRFVREHPGLYEATYRFGAARPAEYDETAQEILSLLYRLLRPFGFSETDGVHAIRGLRSLLHGFASIESDGGFRMNVDRDESLNGIISRYIDGFGSADA